MPELAFEENDFKKFSRYVYDVAGINLHDGKKELLKARLAKILREREFSSFREYYSRVINDTSGYELTLLLNALSTNLTYFFREPQHFDFLEKEVFPELARSRQSSKDKQLRLWSAGCSSGEEAYTMAMTAFEALGPSAEHQIEILATDLSTKVLAMARTGIYKQEKINKIPPKLGRRYFQKGRNRWKGYFRVKKEIREKVKFERLNLIEEFQFDKPFDVIFCRNVMIYFDTPTRQMLVEKLYRTLAPGGYLFIGHSESLTGLRHSFKYIQPAIFKKV